MNHAIILGGGVGTRMKLNIPKQYYVVKGKPIIIHSFNKFATSSLINSIVFVVSTEWRNYIESQLAEENYNVRVFFADAGSSRQHSVYNGLCALREYAQPEDKVLVHDSVRPLFPESIIKDAIEACNKYDAALPVISVKDATYQSFDGTILSAILPRQQLFSGQSPECFLYGKIMKAHSSFNDEEIANIRGTSELAHRAGLSVKLIPGSESNFKITTREDLRAYEIALENCK